MNNERQFAESPFKSWCENFWIRQHFTLVGYPQANGQTENINQTILHGLKTRLDRAQSSWITELPSVLWVYRTTFHSTTQTTPFSLTYRAGAAVPAELTTPSLRLLRYVATANTEVRQADHDLLEERREWSLI